MAGLFAAPAPAAAISQFAAKESAIGFFRRPQSFHRADAAITIAELATYLAGGNRPKSKVRLMNFNL